MQSRRTYCEFDPDIAFDAQFWDVDEGATYLYFLLAFSSSCDDEFSPLTLTAVQLLSVL